MTTPVEGEGPLTSDERVKVRRLLWNWQWSAAGMDRRRSAGEALLPRQAHMYIEALALLRHLEARGLGR